ncbi:ankyrin repeat-containing domain protein [Armillaria nabsnona]|nr:ankyrin repeat-containing domain protein [Armillaria nabsnona]
MHEESLENGPDPSLDEFMEVLCFHLKRCHLIYIAFDAFDEFVDRQEQLISALKSLGSRVRLLVTSRNDTAIQRIFQDDEELRSMMMMTSFLMDHDDLRQNILTRVVEKAQGMALNRLPDTIENACKHFLERVDRWPRGKRYLAYRIFSWVAFAKRPLTILELQHALATRSGTTELNTNKILNLDIISRACIGLVVVDSRGYVRFTHPTIEEYFISQKRTLFPGLQESITSTCLTYMSFDIFRFPSVLPLLKPDISAKYPFLDYASNKWAIHAKNCAPGSVETEILTFLRTQSNIALSFVQSPDLEPEIPRTPAWFSAHYGLVNVMQVLLNEGVDLRHENALCIAAHAGQLEMVKLLLLRSDDMDAVNQADKITYLYNYSADRNDGTDRLEVGDGRASRPIGCTPLIAAASNGHEEIVELLLESNALTSINFLPRDGPTALSAAVFGNYIGVVKLLLSQPGIDTSIPFLDETPLMLAKRKGRDNIVKMFLERERGVGVADDDAGRSSV